MFWSESPSSLAHKSSQSTLMSQFCGRKNFTMAFNFLVCSFSATKMTGRPGHWSEPGEYNILFLSSVLVISSQDSSALGHRKFTQEGAMTISPFAAREGTGAPQWPIVKKCCRHLVPSSDFFVQSYAVCSFKSWHEILSAVGKGSLKKGKKRPSAVGETISRNACPHPCAVRSCQ